MKVYVTGASGYVGRNLLAHLLKRGDFAVALSRSDDASRRIHETAATVNSSVRIARGEIPETAIDELARGMEGCQMLFHSAAKVEGMGPLQPFLDTNVEGTKNLLAAAKQAGVRRFVHIGTEALLLRDGSPVHLADETRPLQEPPFPAPYSISKLRGEQAVVAANDPANGFDTMVVRPRYVWGQGIASGDTNEMPGLLEEVDSGSYRFFSPRYLTSSTNINNLVNGAVLAAEKGTAGEVYFIADGPPRDFEDFITAMILTQGRSRPQTWRIPFTLAWLVATILESIPFLGYSISWGSETFTRQMLGLAGHELTVDDSKARRELGYRGITVEEGLQGMREAHAAARK